MKRELRKRLAHTGDDASFTRRLGASSLITVVRRDDLDAALDSDARQKAELRRLRKENAALKVRLGVVVVKFNPRRGYTVEPAALKKPRRRSPK